MAPTKPKAAEGRQARGRPTTKPKGVVKKTKQTVGTGKTRAKRKSDVSTSDDVAPQSTATTKETTAKAAGPAPTPARRSQRANAGTRSDSRPPAPVALPKPDKPVARSRQTARRSRPFNPGNRFDSRPAPRIAQAPARGNVTSQTGLIAGEYEVETSVDDKWESYSDHESTLILILEGDKVWGAYDFGMFNGVFFTTERVSSRSGSSVGLRWRGVENGEGTISYDDRHQTGTITFKSSGEVSGTFNGLYGDVTFEGSHVGPPQAGDERTCLSLRSEWNSYSEEEYESARVGRWH